MTQKNNWITLKSSKNCFRIEIIKGLLLQNDINAVIINQQDSSYKLFGESKIMIKEQDLKKATALLNIYNEKRNS